MVTRRKDGERTYTAGSRNMQLSYIFNDYSDVNPVPRDVSSVNLIK
jgi:hypothetical protein